MDEVVLAEQPIDGPCASDVRPPGRDGAVVAARVVALVLAAGSSRRLGTPKALVTGADGRTLLARAVAAAEAAGLGVTVTVPAGGGAVADEAARAAPRGRLIEVPDAAAGMSASIRAGAAAADPAVDGVLVLLVDQWRVTPDDLRALVAAWERAGRTVAAARYPAAAGWPAVPGSPTVLGAPALFGRRFFGVLIGASGDAGARAFLRDNVALVTPVDLPNAGVDLDTPADLTASR